MNEKMPVPQENIVDKTEEQTIKPEDVELVSPTKPMSAEELLQEMEKQGRRSLTINELKQFIEDTTGIIEPQEDDIVIEKETKK